MSGYICRRRQPINHSKNGNLLIAQIRALLAAEIAAFLLSLFLRLPGYPCFVSFSQSSLVPGFSCANKVPTGMVSSFWLTRLIVAVGNNSNDSPLVPSMLSTLFLHSLLPPPPHCVGVAGPCVAIMRVVMMGGYRRA